jgi:hypothetical protein
MYMKNPVSGKEATEFAVAIVALPSPEKMDDDDVALVPVDRSVRRILVYADVVVIAGLVIPRVAVAVPPFRLTHDVPTFPTTREVVFITVAVTLLTCWPPPGVYMVMVLPKNAGWMPTSTPVGPIMFSMRRPARLFEYKRKSAAGAAGSVA